MPGVLFGKPPITYLPYMSDMKHGKAMLSVKRGYIRRLHFDITDSNYYDPILPELLHTA